MGTTRAEIVIERSVQQTFDFVANMQNVPLWLPSVEIEHLSGNARSPGATYLQRIGRDDDGIEYRVEITAVEPTERYAYQVTGGMRGTDMAVEYRFTSMPEGTYLSLAFITHNSPLSMLAYPFAFLARRAGRRQAESLLQRLKTALESQPKYDSPSSGAAQPVD